MISKKAKKYIKDFTMHCSNDLTFGGNAPWISPSNAEEAVEIAEKELLKKVCKWIRDNAINYSSYDYENDWIEVESKRMTEDLKEYIKG